MFRRRNLVLAALAVAACDFPTSIPESVPQWEQTWVVPGDPVRIGAGDLLPAGVGLNADSTMFETTVEGTDILLTLAEMCPECAALDGLNTAKPAFTYTFNTTMSLAAELLAATLTGEHFDLVLAHSLSFDPLRPSDDPAAPRGSLVVTVTSAGSVVGADTVSGDDVAFDSTVVLPRIMEIASVAVDNTLDVEFVIFSPEGDAVEVDASDTLGIRFIAGPVFASEATIEAATVPVEGVGASLELAGVDSVLIDRIQEGALRLDIANPFDLEGTLDMEFDVEDGVIHRSIALQPGASVTSLEFAGNDLQRLLNAGTVTVRTDGVLSAPDGTLTLTPLQAIVLETSIEVVVLVGGEEEN